ncbi:hypothetical protein ACNAN0_03945 [Agrilactobacillus fermenti]|uniref:hypothetical protein n=1 Tax=Agrilactobacillus fermenti TaxID=2586909 RepID=UPI003A5C4030
MSKYNESILTDAGLDLASRAANGQTKFAITRAMTTDQDLTKLSESELRALKQLPNELQSGEIIQTKSSADHQNSAIGTELLFENKDLSKSYNIMAVGLYAKEDGSDDEVLYALATAVEPEFMPDFSDQIILQFKFTIYVIVGRTDNVTIEISDHFAEDVLAIVGDTNDKVSAQDLRNIFLGGQLDPIAGDYIQSQELRNIYLGGHVLG